MAREVDGEVLILDTESDLIHQLNATASFIWNGCDGATSEAQIAAALAKAFDIGHDTALKDVLDTVSALRALKLIGEA